MKLGLELEIIIDYDRLASDKDAFVAGLLSGWVWSKVGVGVWVVVRFLLELMHFSMQ